VDGSLPPSASFAMHYSLGQHRASRPRFTSASLEEVATKIALVPPSQLVGLA
jgi:hypothetical protein